MENERIRLTDRGQLVIRELQHAAGTLEYYDRALRQAMKVLLDHDDNHEYPETYEALMDLREDLFFLSEKPWVIDADKRSESCCKNESDIEFDAPED